MAKGRKKNKGNDYAVRGEQFAENVVKVTNAEPHPAQNAPATPHNR
ncbi:hypothetical protein [Cohnella fermenti]|nr:hypothetical protein [Cohnella fermenti]